MPDSWTPPDFAKEVWQVPDFAKPVEQQPEEGILSKIGKYINPIISPKMTNPQGEDISGQVQGPGFMKVPGMESAGEWIKNKGINTGNYYAGAAGSLLGDIVSGLSTGFDPRTAGLGHG